MRRAVPPETSVPEDPFRAAYDQVNAIRVRAGLPPVPYPPGIGPKAGGDAGTSK